MGFKDGTNNLKVGSAGFDEHVWVDGDRRPGVDARRQLPGGPPHPHPHRGVGPLVAGRPGAHDRAGQGSGAPLGRQGEFDPIDLAATRRRRRAADRRRRPRARWPTRQATASTSCAGATTSPTASTRASASSTPGCSSSRTSAIRARSSSPLQNKLARSTRSTSTSNTSARQSSRIPPGASQTARLSAHPVRLSPAASDEDGFLGRHLDERRRRRGLTTQRAVVWCGGRRVDASHPSAGRTSHNGVVGAGWATRASAAIGSTRTDTPPAGWLQWPCGH